MSQPEEHPVPLDYGHRESWAKKIWAEILQRVDGFIEFLGLIVFYLGGARRIALALALAFVLGGLGICIEGAIETTGHRWMAWGGLLLGFAIPVPRQK